jgi:hypothetical protein
MIQYDPPFIVRYPRQLYPTTDIKWELCYCSQCAGDIHYENDKVLPHLDPLPYKTYTNSSAKEYKRRA